MRQIKHLFGRPKTPRNANPKPHQTETQSDRTSVASASVAPVSASASQANITKTQLEDSPLPQDLWRAAYDQLDRKEQDILSEIHVATLTIKDGENHSQTMVSINKVIQTTEKQYEEYQKGGKKIPRSTGEDIDLRKLSQKIINAALSFKDIISAVVAFG